MLKKILKGSYFLVFLIAGCCGEPNYVKPTATAARDNIIKVPENQRPYYVAQALP